MYYEEDNDRSIVFGRREPIDVAMEGQWEVGDKVQIVTQCPKQVQQALEVMYSTSAFPELFPRSADEDAYFFLDETRDQFNQAFFNWTGNSLSLSDD